MAPHLFSPGDEAVRAEPGQLRRGRFTGDRQACQRISTKIAVVMPGRNAEIALFQALS
jgi:hypothetical protein